MMLTVLRSAVKRLLTVVFGKYVTHWVHERYHALLRRTGAFGLPETATTQQLLRILAGEAKTILDVGANNGRYSWFMARHRRDGVPVYGFEPNPEAFRLAKRNLAGLPSVTLLPVGLGDKEQAALLAIPSDPTGISVSGLGFILRDDRLDRNSTTQSVVLKTLDGLITQGEIDISSPVMLKIDIEGYEPAALAGMAIFLAQHRPWIYFECEEQHLQRCAYDWRDLFTPLHRLGYQILVETSGQFKIVQQPEPGHVNYFALVLETIPAAALPILSVTG